MRVLVTGADGFLGRNLQLALTPRQGVEVVKFTRSHAAAGLLELLSDVDFVFHLAGVNRPPDPHEFEEGNGRLTAELASCLSEWAVRGRRIPVVYASSIQAALDNPYGRSKRAGEAALQQAAKHTGFPVHVFRLPNVFGKWSRPDYNSVVATFSHRIARGLPIEVRDPAAPLQLVYVDDVIGAFLQLLDGEPGVRDTDGFSAVAPQFKTTVGEVAAVLEGFKASRSSLHIGPVGKGLVRALYATYVSFLPGEAFSYPVASHTDPRGTFVEMLKTHDSGQFSFFTAHPGVTRGGHYHHTKTEKFLVVSGTARFRFRHMLTGESLELTTSGDAPRIVETVPGWTHDITNVGPTELIVILWANETFDHAVPDTFACKLEGIGGN
jgi:UDP-2-acetamido-2,6-beta-L-arabino-hexul-4-ose reductase